RKESVLSSLDFTFFITFSNLVITLPVPSLFTKPSPSIPKSSVLAFHDSGVLLNRRSGVPQFSFILSSLSATVFRPLLFSSQLSATSVGLISKAAMIRKNGEICFKRSNFRDWSYKEDEDETS
ncbi:hypothetical protein V2J09_011974, partial [Rumex salicifolius]